MSNKNNFIEINGKRYDAESGKLLAQPTSASHTAVKTHPGQLKPVHHAVRQSAKHSSHHTPTASKILMRQAVQKPGPSLKRQIKAQSQMGLERKTLSDVDLPAVRQKVGAKRVPKSQFIRHFSPIEPTSVQNLAVAAPAKPSLGTPVHDILPRPSAAHSLKTKGTQTTADLLERALRQATSHEQKPLKKPRSHLKRQVGVLASVALAVGLLTVIASQNLSGAQLQVASAKAGFSAKLPDYKPAGFSQTGLDSSRGIVATQFRSNSDDRNYTITQKTSSWSTSALLDNFVTPQDANYDTHEANGRTVYIYGNHNATWVNNGIWYIVQANGALSDHQLVELAASL